MKEINYEKFKELIKKQDERKEETRKVQGTTKGKSR